jgi:transmembrane sensor
MATPSPDDTLSEAIEWQLRLGSGDAGAVDHADFNRWLDSQPQRATVWQRLQSLDDALQAATTAAARSAVVQMPSRRTRRSISGTLVALALLTFLGATANPFMPLQHLMADARTGTGERRSLTLPDGSRLHLNSRSAVDIAFNARQRRLRLRAGEIAIDTAQADPAADADPRPFIVDTPQGELRALGTRFLVRLDDQATPQTTQLTVLQHAVAARPGRCGPSRMGACPAQRVIAQGQSVALSVDAVSPTVPASPDADAWREHMLVFDNARMADVVAAIARQRAGHIALDPSLADRRVSGTFPLGDTDRALDALVLGSSSAGAPVQLQRYTRWWVRIAPVAAR